ncbi:MAG: hypothetical protein AAF985_05785 [Bacteroidota bacterium]
MNLKLITLLFIGVWIGMLLGISFVEAPLKFRAPNITLPLGLGIGRLVFAALNKFEIGFSLVIGIWLFQQFKSINFSLKVGLTLPILLVLLQTVWLIPILDVRAEQIIQGVDIEKSIHHLLYIVFEVVKLLLLLFCFLKVYRYEGHLG